MKGMCSPDVEVGENDLPVADDVLPVDEVGSHEDPPRLSRAPHGC